MSRPNVFRRIASWLKTTSQITEKRKQQEALRRVHRQYSVQTLESREMLAADFSFDNVTNELVLDNFSEIVNESLTITQTATEFRFILSEGTWTGVDDAVEGVLGNGSNELRVDRTDAPVPFDIDLVQINDTLGVDISFGALDFNNGPAVVNDLIINSNGGDIQQTAVSTLDLVNLTINGANNVDLSETGNQINLVTVSNTNNVQIRDNGFLNLGAIQVNQDAEFENNGLMTLTAPMSVGGELSLNSNNGDIVQEEDASIFVGGDTFLKSSISDAQGIDFSFGDNNMDGINDNDFVGAVHVLQGAQIEINDSNSLILGGVQTHGNHIADIFQLYAEAEDGSLTLEGEISVLGNDDGEGKVILRATDGVTQTARSTIATDSLVLIGSGNFDLGQGNEVFNPDTTFGILSADIDGNLNFRNESAFNVGGTTFQKAPDLPNPPLMFSVTTVEVQTMADGTGGNLTVTTSDDDVSQQTNASVNVAGLTTIDIGTGGLLWEFGDELGSLTNDNDWNQITVLSANEVSFIDRNAIEILDVNVANDARFQADDDNALILDGQILVGNNVLFQSDVGVEQTSGFIEAAGLMVAGNGDFLFELANRLGDATTSGLVAANLNTGELLVENRFGIEVAALGAFGVNLVGIDGAGLDQALLRGSSIQVNQVMNVGDALLEADTTISQTAGITADSLIVRSNGDTTLSSVNSVAVLAGEVEGDFSFNSGIEFSIGELTYNGNTVAGLSVQNGSTNNFDLVASGVDVHQIAGAPINVEGTLTIDVGLGCVGFDQAGNDFNTVVVTSASRVEIVDDNDITTNAINVSDQIRIKSETGTINLEGDLVATNKVLLQAGDGVVQNPDGGGVEGVIDTQAIMLQGEGDFILDHLNAIGSAAIPGEIAVDIDGTLELNNQFSLATKNLTFDLKDGGVVIINGFNIDVGGDALVLNVSGLLIESEIAAPKIIINATGDIIQGSSGRFITDALVLNGVANFELTAMNQIGTALTPGLVAINVEGNVEIVNEFGLEFGEIICGTDLFHGANLIQGDSFADANLTLRTMDGDITQSGDSFFNVEGTMTLDTGAGDVNLLGKELIDEDDQLNDFNSLIIDSGNHIEISDVSSITVETVDVTGNLFIETGLASTIILDDIIEVDGQLMLKSGFGVTQQRGLIDADTLFLYGSNDFDLLQNNEINNLAAEISGNLNLNNVGSLQVIADTYTDQDGLDIAVFEGLVLTPAFRAGNFNVATSGGDFTQAGGSLVRIFEAAVFDLGAGSLTLTEAANDLNVLAIQSAFDGTVTDQNSIGVDNVNIDNDLMIESLGGSISVQGEVSADNMITLIADAGAGTRDGALLDSDALSIQGNGEFDLDGNNRIGAAAIAGLVDINVVGNVILHNDFALELQDINVDSNGLNGNLFVQASGNITDNDAKDIDIDGNSAFVADPGSDVDLGGPNAFSAASVGLGGQNVSIMMDNATVLDGAQVGGDLFVQSTGSITQSGNDPSGLVGSRFLNVNGVANFVVDSVGVQDLGVNLLSSGTNLMNNRFLDEVIIEGTSFLTTGDGQLGNVQFRNTVQDAALFPTINRLDADQLSGLSVWAPNSSLLIKGQVSAIDYDVIGNMTVLAGVDAESGVLGDKLKVTDNAMTRSVRDAAGISIDVGGNLNTNAANTLVLGDNATDSIEVGGTLSLVNQGGANENRIRIGVGAGGNRGNDSGANVTSSFLRTRANRIGDDGHVTVNLDSDVVFTNSSFGKSLVVVSGGNIEDDANAKLTVINSAFFDADGGAGNVTLGDDNDTNRTIFGTVGFLANDVDFTEDTSMLVDGSEIGGNFAVLVNGSIRQSGLDRSGRVGSGVLNVAGDTEFTLDGNTIPGNHLVDPAGRDVILMNDGGQNLIDNSFGGGITVQSTQQVSGGNGTVRNVAIRNVAANAETPVFNVDASDRLKNLTLWHVNSSVDLSSQANAVDYDVAGKLVVIAGLDSTNGKVNGTKFIVDDSVIRDITDQNNVSISVGRNASFYAANHINLVNDASNSLLVGFTSTFFSAGGAQGNQIDVGTAGPRGTDSGGTYETRRLKFTIVDTGIGGDLTIVADKPFILDPSSSAPSVVLAP